VEKKKILTVDGFALREMPPTWNFNWILAGVRPENQKWCSTARKGQEHWLPVCQSLLVFFRGIMSGVCGELIYKGVVSETVVRPGSLRFDPTGSAMGLEIKKLF